MHHQESLKTNRNDLTQSAGTGVLRIVLLFGSVAIALGLILVPMLGDRKDAELTQSIFQNKVDYTTMTGSVNQSAIPQVDTVKDPQ
ncbi:hypothetical protein H3S89_04505 [Bartonella sp. B10834G6]|uniref:Uncharacterized protein n=1 Tax=Bartonella apis TaxID=1686310 RepID=A0A1R0F8Q1_9HYPH|nr:MULTISPECIES: hypothetical protein [Bartonella]MBH9982058.1 hypothetical protein [Bartonella apis]MBH9987995.1 hypothetical protein [Bartonella apis]MBI0169619.1 hypothetical protein [Bartonella sp. W8167]MBI0171928.1 hypothetical protein [Bartonella sp. W8151]MBI0174393.1 hypothetical protein [Bartonella apis]